MKRIAGDAVIFEGDSTVVELRSTGDLGRGNEVVVSDRAGGPKLNCSSRRSRNSRTPTTASPMRRRSSHRVLLLPRGAQSRSRNRAADPGIQPELVHGRVDGGLSRVIRLPPQEAAVRMRSAGRPMLAAMGSIS